jgi:hypothetical protein
MADLYRVFGLKMSPGPVGVRSHFRFKAIPHQRIFRDGDCRAEYRKSAKLPSIPRAATGRQNAAAVPERAALDPVLEAGCLATLRP